MSLRRGVRRGSLRSQRRRRSFRRWSVPALRPGNCGACRILSVCLRRLKWQSRRRALFHVGCGLEFVSQHDLQIAHRWTKKANRHDNSQDQYAEKNASRDAMSAMRREFPDRRQTQCRVQLINALRWSRALGWGLQSLSRAFVLSEEASVDGEGGKLNSSPPVTGGNVWDSHWLRRSRFSRPNRNPPNRLESSSHTTSPESSISLPGFGDTKSCNRPVSHKGATV